MLKNVVFVCVFLLSATSARAFADEVCNDERDNDLDGLLDCVDPDCRDADGCDTFVCSGQVVQFSDDAVILTDTSVTPFEYNTVGTVPDPVNALGFNRLDGFYYGVRTDNAIMRIAPGTPASSPAVTIFGEVPRIGDAVYHQAGDVDVNGHLWLRDGDADILDITLDGIEEGVSAIRYSDVAVGFGDDIVVSPNDGRVYSYNSLSLYAFDPRDGTTETLPVTGGEYGTFGAQWMDASGLMYVVRNGAPGPGDVFAISIGATTATAVLVGSTGTLLARNDAAVCSLGLGDFEVCDNGIDDDGDGLIDENSGANLCVAVPDTDDDAVFDHVDLDDDNDGIPDVWEFGDTDGDGVPDRLDLDSDGDGIADGIEAGHGLFGALAVCPGEVSEDGLCDVLEMGGVDSASINYELADSDDDGTVDFRDLDSDDDGIVDAIEGSLDDVDATGDGAYDCLAGVGLNGWCDSAEATADSGVAAALPADTDDDDVPDYLDLDTDGDSLLDEVERGGLPVPADTDLDGDPDFRDLDSDDDGVLDGAPDDGDGDGIPDLVENDGDPSRDTDTDSTPDRLDLDSDNDGIPDQVEAGATPTTPVDSDEDGTPDYLDTDSDDDGLLDSYEAGSLPATPVDTDDDGTPDYLDIDSDDDGLFDVEESNLGVPVSTDTDGVPDHLDLDSDGDAIPDEVEAPGGNPVDSDLDGDADYVDLDSDDDGIPDSVEAGATPSTPVDTDDDGDPDYLDLDADDDGIIDEFEAGPTPADPIDSDDDGTADFRDLDSDGDGLTDEIEGSGDPDMDGDPSYVDLDSDGDGIPDADEADLDSDDDGTPDYLDTDDDNDGVPTAEEGATTDQDTDDDGTPDYLDTDDDNDGVPTTEEGATTDQDTDDDGTPDYLDADDDNDGVPTTDEGASTDQDTDEDGTPDYRDTDDDNDGVPTTEEGATTDQDTDDDGTPDYLDTDDDEDGLSTFEEGATTDQDTDEDGTPDYLDADDDDDGLPTSVERGDATEHGNDVDNDETDNWLDTDSDADGLTDLEEGRDDDNGDGVPDYLQATVIVVDSIHPGFSGGAGCSVSSGGASAPWQLGLLAVFGFLCGVPRRRRAAKRAAPATLFALALSLLSAEASAQSFTLDRYQPAPLADDGFVVARPVGLAHLDFGAQLVFEYANDPLVWETNQGEADSEQFSAVEHQLVGHVLLAFGLWDRLTLSAGLPVNLVMSGDDRVTSTLTGDVGGPSLGDLNFAASLRILGTGDDLFKLGVEARVFVPTAGEGAFTGEKGATFEPTLLTELQFGAFRWNLNLGARIRSVQDFGSLDVGSELTLKTGIAYAIVEGPTSLTAYGELFGSTPAGKIRSSAFADREASPLELLLGAKLRLANGLSTALGAGPGLSRGAGSPDFRVVASVGWDTGGEETPAAPVDTDGDGLFDDVDQCPTDPEDFDAFQDTDGCSDPDNDQDRVLDVNDGAPLIPEDHDGFEDTDGVADPDNDQDGVLDGVDRCPLQAGPATNEGCPLPDRDGDGVPDAQDNCPDEPGPVSNRGCQVAQQVVITDSGLEILDIVHFKTNSDEIDPQSFALLTNVATVISNHPEISMVEVQGHTDARGRRDYNMRLSSRRAASVVRYLVSKGVAAARLRSAGYGPDRPVVPDAATDEDLARNRRVEFVLVGADGTIRQQHSGPSTVVD